MSALFWKPLAWAVARQALLGLAVVAASLPLLFALSRALGVGRPPEEGLATLGGSAVLGFAAGGLIGAFGRAFGGRMPHRRLHALVSVAGLACGVTLCGLALPLYLDDVLDDVTDAGTAAAVSRVGAVLDRPTDALDQAWAVVGELVQEGATRLPALALLGWTLLGPALAAPLEAPPPRHRR